MLSDNQIKGLSVPCRGTGGKTAPLERCVARLAYAASQLCYLAWAKHSITTVIALLVPSTAYILTVLHCAM